MLPPNSSGHNPMYQRMMQYYRSGAYDIDKTEPESMDIPEVCSFRNDDGLLDRKDIGFCCDEIIVTVDKEFGIIPVCKAHLKWVIKPMPTIHRKYQQYLTRI